MAGRYRSPLLAGMAAAGVVLASCAAPEPDAADHPWSWEMPGCVAYRPTELRAPEHRLSVTVRHQPGLVEQVETYQDGWGARAMAEIRTVVQECASYEAGGSGDPDAFREQHWILETGFAGDDALLVETVRLTPPQTWTGHATAVRYGDVVATQRTSGWGAAVARCLAVAGPGGDPATCLAGQA